MHKKMRYGLATLEHILNFLFDVVNTFLFNKILRGNRYHCKCINQINNKYFINYTLDNLLLQLKLQW